ncbi:hypothetical protein LCGC14_1665880, partial [marine sediment metagenome]
MNSPIRLKGVFIITMVLSLGLTSCNEKESIDTEKEVSKNQKAESVMAKKELSETFKSYWYAGDAEITSYQLQQARYGETRDGKAVLIYVTEPFLPEAQVKADESHPDNVPVLKLNTTKNYLTGIYPYSIMTSSFYPVHDNQHAIKLSFSAQEWCGQVYAQLNNREQFDVMSHSYFESEGDQNLQLEKTILENEIWNKIPTEVGLDLIAAAEALLDAARTGVSGLVVRDGRVEAAALETHQFAAHGFAWAATYVESLRQMLGWAGRCRDDGSFGELEALILQCAFGEYCAQLAGGIALSQVEVARPGDMGVVPGAVEAFRKATAEIVEAGNTAAARQRIVE